MRLRTFAGASTSAEPARFIPPITDFDGLRERDVHAGYALVRLEVRASGAVRQGERHAVRGEHVVDDAEAARDHPLRVDLRLPFELVTEAAGLAAQRVDLVLDAGGRRHRGERRLEGAGLADALLEQPADPRGPLLGVARDIAPLLPVGGDRPDPGLPRLVTLVACLARALVQDVLQRLQGPF